MPPWCRSCHHAITVSHPSQVEVPGVALLLLIDRSGSMVGTPIQLAREAAIAASEALHDDDLVCVIAFDEEPHWVFQERVLKAGKRDYIAGLISRIRVGGGTDIYPALRVAQRGRTPEGTLPATGARKSGLPQSLRSRGRE